MYFYDRQCVRTLHTLYVYATASSSKEVIECKCSYTVWIQYARWRSTQL